MDIHRLVDTFFNASIAAQYWPDILKGMQVTVVLGLAVIVSGLVLGLILALLRSSERKWLNFPIVLFADVMRSLPPLVVIILLFFAFPYIDLAMSAFTATWLALTLTLAAYAEESLWAGISSVPRGQREAARSSGLSWAQTMGWVIVPQAWRIALPSLTNRVIAIAKNTALGSVVALSEIINNAQSASSNTGNPTPLVLGALGYLAIFIPLVLFSRWLESRLAWKR
ncbi:MULTISPECIES: amino acid ABC transporter permease [unclassified Pseudomonas]|uniref:amino acid ABC transporter permease n=1 Tax=unclassified Pseudomonas TaxID=196821 RepID=UPI001C49A2D5|nr:MULTISPECIES: amino acid ABC transporter permease [unclassified Pseudomonas]